MFRQEGQNIKRSWIHTSVSYLLLTLMSVYLVSISTFTHTHIVDGVKIVHSHPFKDNQHKHSSQQLVLFQSLSHYDSVVPHSYSIDFRLLLSEGESILTHYDSSCNQLFAGFTIGLRAPPVLG